MRDVGAKVLTVTYFKSREKIYNLLCFSLRDAAWEQASWPTEATPTNRVVLVLHIRDNLHKLINLQKLHVFGM